MTPECVVVVEDGGKGDERRSRRPTVSGTSGGVQMTRVIGRTSRSGSVRDGESAGLVLGYSVCRDRTSLGEVSCPRDWSPLSPSLQSCGQDGGLVSVAAEPTTKTDGVSHGEGVVDVLWFRVVRLRVDPTILRCRPGPDRGLGGPTTASVGVGGHPG